MPSCDDPHCGREIAGCDCLLSGDYVVEDDGWTRIGDHWVNLKSGAMVPIGPAHKENEVNDG